LVSRRDFLTIYKGVSNDVDTALRPPYALNETLFKEMCPDCESKSCISSCQQSIILLDKGGIPKLDFTNAGCTFCEDCASSCKFDVLSIENKKNIYANLYIVSQSCVAHNGVVCFLCKDPCIDHAILFNGLFSPVIDMDLCSSCGYCISRCPTDSIKIEVIKNIG
jgi:ferredoxin-type protein NapF